MVTAAKKDSRHNYCPDVAGDNNDSIWTAWLGLNKEGDDIYIKGLKNDRWSEEIKVTDRSGKIYRPCLVTHPEDGVGIFWTENTAKGWRLCGRHYDTGGKLKDNWTQVEEGRPHNLHSHDDGNGNIYLAWESHSPGKTVIKMAKLVKGKLSTPWIISNPLFNSYDPSLASDSKGNLWIAYTSFQQGNYDIFCRSYNVRDKLPGKEQKVSWINGYSYYPTVAVDSQDRVWFSFVSYVGEYRMKELLPLVKTELRRRQHSFWLNRRYIYCVCLDRGKWYVPIKKDAPQPHRCTGVVPAPEDATYPHIIFDSSGKLWVFYRHFRFNEKTSAWRSQISAVCHQGEQWSSPVIEPAEELLGDAEPIPLVRDKKGKFWYAWQVDYRTYQEYFDKESREDISLRFLDPAKMEGSPPELYPLSKSYTPVISSSNAETKTHLTLRGKQYRLVFGNIHRHSEISGCDRPYNGSFDLHYRQARDVMGENFSAITDHGSSSDDLNRHRNLKAIALYHSPPFFVAIPSVEWTASERKGVEKLGESLGHYNIHYFGKEQEAVPYAARDFGYSDTPDKIWKLLGSKKALTIVHHPADWDHHHGWDYYHPQFEPVVEIFQDLRGSAEYGGCPGSTGWRQTPREGCFVQDALEKGYKLGFIGGGDHFGVALAGVYVERLSREGLFEALRERRCFATTGIKLHIDFRLNERFMGEIVRLDGERKRILYIKVTAPERIHSITIVRNNRDIYTQGGKSKEESFEYHDNEPLKSLLQERENGRPSIYYYLRIILVNGEMGWASPIWVEIKE